MLSLAQVLRRYHLRIDLTSGGRDLAVVESRPVGRRGERESPGPLRVRTPLFSGPGGSPDSL